MLCKKKQLFVPLSIFLCDNFKDSWVYIVYNIFTSEYTICVYMWVYNDEQIDWTHLVSKCPMHTNAILLNIVDLYLML